jgi:hypothetical protein
MSTNDPFFSGGRWFKDSEMKASGLTCTLHMPRRREKQFRGGVEVAQSLPEGNPRQCFLVDELPAAPEEWLRSTSGVLSYVVPVLKGHGLWLDFNGCHSHTHHVAVMISSQGVCAITGQPFKDMGLQQYRETCPKHGCQFTGERFCEECGYKWPPQNYLPSNVMRSPYLWRDGFFDTDGTTRQWYFTDKVEESVAAAIIGEDRVHAIGIEFRLSKEPKPKPTFRSRGDLLGTYLESAGGSPDMFATKGATLGGGTFRGPVRTRGAAPRRMRGASRSFDKLEIGAGAKIHQEIPVDREPISFWQDEIAARIVINYCPAEQLQAIIEEGGIKTRSEGFLSELNLPSS